MLLSVARHLRLVALLASCALAPNLFAHNLDTTSTALQYSADFIETMKTRATNGQALIQPGDEFWVAMKTTPGPGTTTGVGGYMTFYVPGGFQVADAAYVTPSSSDPRGFINAPIDGQSPIALGAGPVGAKLATGLTSYVYPSNNILGVNEAPTTSAGISRGTIAGVYADTGIFYSTDVRTVFNSYGAAPVGGTSPMINNSGDTVGEWFAVGLTNKLGVMTLWDSYQLRAFGRKDVAPIIDTPDGRGNAPWGMAGAVAGPQSGYAWAFNFNAYSNTVGSTTAKVQAGVEVGPWNRIKYPGSQVSSDTAGSASTTLGNAGIDASSIGYDFSASGALPTNVNAVRFAIGQLELGRPEYAAVKLKVGASFSVSNSIYADAFGGDAGGASSGKDHLWRYFDPTVAILTPSVLLQKVVANPLVAPGGTTYFDITFANTGATSLPNVVLTDVLPTGLVYLSCSPAPSSVSGQTITWNLGGMLPNTIRTFRMYVKATGVGTFLNRVTAATSGTPVAVADDTVEVSSRALLREEKTVTPSNSTPGSTVTYTLTVYNDGTGANGVPLVITDTLPAGFTYASLVSTTLNGGATASGVVAVNASNTAKPVFTVSQAIQPGKTFVAVFTANVGAGVTPGTYYNQALLQFEGKDIPPRFEAPVTIGGAQIGNTVYRDWNGNGVQDATDGGLPGVTVQLYASNGTTLLASQVTDANGNYLFTGLGAGTYVVKVGSGVPAGYTLTGSPAAPLSNQYTATVTANQQLLTVDFGYRPGGTGSISGITFDDQNNDGDYDVGDPGIPNVPVSLYYDANGNGVYDSGTDPLVSTQDSNGSGNYTFTTLATGLNYLVVVNASSSAITTYFSPYTPNATTVTTRSVLNLTGAVTNQNFGFFAGGAAVGDQVFLDNNLNGTFDAGDTPLGGVTISLYDLSNNLIASTVSSSADGTYMFSDLPAGSYTVVVDTASASIPDGYIPYTAQYIVTLAAGQTDLTADFGFANYLSKTVSAAYATNGQTITFSIFPRYPSSELLSSVRVIDPLPPGTSYVTNSATNTGGTFGPYSSVPGVPGAQPADNADPLDPIPGITNTLTVSTNFLRVSNTLTVTMNVRASTNLTAVTPGDLTTGGVGTFVASAPSFTIISGPTPASTNVTTNTNGVNFTWTVRPDTLGEYIFTADATDSATNSIPAGSSPSVLAVQSGGPNVVTWNIGNNTAPVGGETNLTGNPAGIYAFGGGANTFRTYGVISSNWSSLSNLPTNTVDSAGTTFATNNNLIYATRGTGFQNFYAYNITNNTWTNLANVGANLAAGSSIVYLNTGGTNFVYASVGNGKNFRRYNIGANSWAALTSAAKNMKAGSQLVTDGTNIFAAGGGGKKDFQRYNAGAGNWTTLTAVPGAVGAGGGAARVGTDIYVLRGNSTANLYSYSITGSNWTTLSNAPGTVTTGGKMTTDGTNLFVFRGGTNTFWRYNVASSNWSTLPNFPTNTAAGSTLTYAPQLGTISGRYSTLSATPALGGTNTTATVTLSLRSTELATNVTPPTNLTVATNNGATATKLTGPTPASTNITTTNGIATFTYTYRVNPGSQPGSIIFSGGGTATNSVTFPTATANSVLLTPTLTFQATVTNTTNGVITNNAILGDNGTVIGSVPSNDTFTATAGSIGDLVWVDSDGNGVQGTNETGLAGVTVGVYASNNVTLIGSAVTDGTGAYRVNNLSAATYVVRPTSGVPAGYIATTTVPQNVVLAAGQQYNDADFGYQPAATGSISGQLWIDVNSDGAVDTGESNIPNIPVALQKLVNGTWTTIASTTTDSTGAYSFTGLPAGTYRLAVDSTATIVSPYSASYSGQLGQVTDPTYDPDDTTPPITTPNFATVTLPTSTSALTQQNFGYVWNGTLGQLVWYDNDESGIPNPANPAPNGTLALYVDINGNGVIDAGEDYIIAVMTTGNGSVDYPNPDGQGNGYYTFTGLPPGKYVVAISEQEVPSPTSGQINTMVLTTEEYIPSTLSAGAMAATNANFGLAEKGQISGRVFYDPNLNGVFDSGDVPLSGVTVYVYDETGTTVLFTTTTNASGEYTFLLSPGNYVIRYNNADIPPAYSKNTTPAEILITAVSGASSSGYDFGVADNGLISGTVFGDVNSDGTQGPGEPGLAGITVANYRASGGATNLLATDVTDSLGFYEFAGLAAATNGTNYFVQVETSGLDTNTYKTIPTGYPVGANTNTSGWSTALTNGQSITNVNWGYPLVPGDYYKIGGKIYNGPGPTAQPADPAIPGVKVTVEVDEDGDGTYDKTYTVTTDSNGNYVVEGIKKGSKVRITVDESTLPNEAYGITGDPTGGGSPTKTYVINDLQADSTDLNFGYEEDLGSIAGTVVANSNGNGTAEPGETPVAGVTVTLTQAGPDGILGTADDVVSNTTTDANGDYLFSNLLPGPFEIVTTPPANYTPLADANGGNPNNITSTLSRGENLTAQDFEYTGPGSITGTVLIDTNGDGTGDTPLQGATLTLVDSSGNPVLDGSGDPITTTTDSNGDYNFSNVPAGTYGVKKTPSSSYRSYSDIDGGNPDYITNIVVTDDTESSGNDFVVQNLECPNTWPNWQSVHTNLPNTNVTGNNDGDMQSNLFEYAFCMDPENGEGSPYCLVASLSNAATQVDLVFSRTLGGATDITYELQKAANLTTNTSWTTLPLPTNVIVTTNYAVGDESVRVPNLGAVTGLTNSGFIRMKVTLASTNPSENGATAAGEVGGWIKTPLTTNNRTFNDPFLACPTWSGTVGSVSGNNIGVPVPVASGNADLSFLGTGTDGYYIEITSGALQGQRFDIAGGGVNFVTISPDANLNSVDSPYNTWLGAPPAALTNSTFAVRKHRTLGSLFPTNLLVASGDPTTATLLQLTAGTTNTVNNTNGAGWISYFFCNTATITNRWALVGDANLNSQMSKVIPPGQGSFLQARTNGTFMLFGKVRANDFVSPLAQGLNLFGGGYPLAQSPAARVMNRTTGFFATNNFVTADQFMLWRGDTEPAFNSYVPYYLLYATKSGQPTLLQWTRNGDNTLVNVSSNNLFIPDYGTLIRVQSAITNYTTPLPWGPGTND
jgi:large repetitive protein